MRKRLIKVRQIPTRRYAYYLTPKGLAEKSRLTVEYLSYSLSFFAKARPSCADALDIAEKRRWKHIGLLGAGDLAEIAALCAHERQCRVIVVVDPDWQEERFGRMPVVPSIDGWTKLVDGWIVTALNEPQAVYDEAIQVLEPTRVIAPDILGLVLADGEVQ